MYYQVPFGDGLPEPMNSSANELHLRGYFTIFGRGSQGAIGNLGNLRSRAPIDIPAGSCYNTWQYIPFSILIFLDPDPHVQACRFKQFTLHEEER